MILTNLDFETIEIDTGNICQLKCPTCNRQDKDFKHLLQERKHLDLEDFKTMVEKFPNAKRFFLGLMFDEPTFNPHLFEIIKYLKLKNKFITINTNGCNNKFTNENWKNLILSLNEHDKIIWSLDGLTNETYLQHRKNGDFKSIIKNLTISTNIKMHSRPTHIVQIIKFSHNKEEVENNFELFKSKYNRLWGRPTWHIIESNGQSTIETPLVKPTWNIEKQIEIKNKNIISDKIIQICTNKLITRPTLYVSHTGVIGLCLSNLISNLKNNKPLNINNSIESINSEIQSHYENILSDNNCQFYCGEKSIQEKENAKLDPTIT